MSDYAQENRLTSTKSGSGCWPNAWTTTIVAGDGSGRRSASGPLSRFSQPAVINPDTPEFDTLLKSRGPFLLVSKAGPSLKQVKERWVLTDSFLAIRSDGFEIENYEVEILRSEQTNNGARDVVAYGIRPKRTPRSAAQPRSAIASTRPTE